MPESNEITDSGASIFKKIRKIVDMSLFFLGDTVILTKQENRVFEVTVR